MSNEIQVFDGEECEVLEGELLPAGDGAEEAFWAEQQGAAMNAADDQGRMRMIAAAQEDAMRQSIGRHGLSCGGFSGLFGGAL